MSQQYDDAKFRALFPEFSDDVKYPPAQIEVFWGVAVAFVGTQDSPCNVLNGNRLNYVLNCMTAHLLALALQDGQTSPGGPGSNQGGFVTSSSIDKISVSTLAPPAKDGWEWWLAQTSYGQRIWAMLQVLAVGGLSIGGLPERNSFRKVGGVFW